VRGADTVAVGDGGESLDVRAENLLERAGLRLAEFGELRCDVRDRAVVLADLDALDGARGVDRLRGRSVSVLGERPGESVGTCGERRSGVDGAAQVGGESCRTMLGEVLDGLIATGLAQVAQRSVGEVVVGMRELRPTCVGECIGTSRSAPAAVGGRARFALDEQAVRDEGVEVPADRRGREPQPIGELGGGQRAILEDRPGHQVAGAVSRPITGAKSACRGAGLDFHNTIMTYFRRSVPLGVRVISHGRLRACCTGRWS